ncbi:ProP Permeases of the major facilitator superfamily [Burkholderiaceae bacterium]
MSSTLETTNIVPWRQDAQVMGLVGLVHASSHFSHLLLPLMFPAFMQDFGLGYAQLGLLMSVFFVVSGIGQALSGFFVDHFGARPVLYASLAMLALACASVTQVQGYGGLMCSAILFGLGNCTFHPVDFTILNNRVSEQRLGHAFSTHGLTGNLGWAAAPTFMVGISTLSHWRTAYACAALVFVSLLLLCMFQRAHLHTEPQRHPTQGVKPAMGASTSLSFLRLPVVWWCFGFFVFSTMTLAVVQSFSVSILQSLVGVSFEAATHTLTAYLVCAALGMLAGGFMAATFAKHTQAVVAGSMLSAALLLVICATTWLGPMGSMLAMAITGFAAGVGGPSRDLMIKQATPKGATGRVYGMVYSGMDVGFAIAPALFGVFMDHGWYAATLVGVSLTLVVSAALAVVVGRQEESSV